MGTRLHLECFRFGLADHSASPTLFIAFWRSTALLVGQDHVRLKKPQAVGTALYCAKVAVDLKQKLMDRSAASRLISY